MDAMYREARALGVFPLRDPLEDLDIKIRMVRVFNVSGTAA